MATALLHCTEVGQQFHQSPQSRQPHFKGESPGNHLKRAELCLSLTGDSKECLAIRSLRHPSHVGASVRPFKSATTYRSSNALLSSRENGLLRVSPFLRIWRRKITRRRCTTSTSESNANAHESVLSPGSPKESFLTFATSLYPVYVTLGGALGVWQPQIYHWFLAGAPGSLSLALGVIMAAMGITLRLEELVSVLTRRPKAVLFGCSCQYLLMPLSGLAIATLFRLPPDLTAGLLLLSCCPGGTASNVVTLIANGDVPLSIVMTLISTLLACVATPILTKLLTGAIVPVDVLGLSISTLQVVLLPVLFGAGVNSRFPAAASAVAPFCPLVAVLVSSLLASSVFSSTLTTFMSSVKQGLPPLASPPVTGIATVAAAVVALHFLGFLLGYAVSRLAGYDESQRRAVSIEVGMQNSSLGVLLALKHLPSPTSALPAALSAIIMNVMGSTLGSLWRMLDTKTDDRTQE